MLMARQPSEGALLAVLSAADTMRLTDRELLAQFTVGDQSAFAAVVKRHNVMVLGVCRRMLPTMQDAEDACQATFLVLARKAKTVRWQSSIANWLYTTARRLASKANRAATQRMKRESQVAPPALVSALDQLTLREGLVVLDEELDRLPALYREPLVLCYLQGLTRDEAAARLGFPSATLKSQLERGRKKLADALTKRGIEIGAGLLAVAATSSAVASSPRLVESILATVSGSPSASVTAIAKGAAVNVVSLKAKFLALAAVAAVTGIGLASLQIAAEPQPASALPASDEKKDASAPQAGAKSQAGPKVQGLVVSGQVVDKATGKPISAATVTIAHSPERLMMSLATQIKCRTDAEGKYSVTIPSDQRVFCQAKVEHPDYAPMYTPGTISHALGSSAKPFSLPTMELSAGEQVTGVVHTSEGKPASGVKVIGYSTPQRDNGGRRFPLFSSLAQASTDAGGKFSLRMLSSNEAVLWIAPEDFAPSAQVLKDKRGDRGTITLEPGVKLRGQLLDVKGKPVPGVYVNMRATDPIDGYTEFGYTIYYLKRAALTNEKGEFAMQPVPPGKYLVQPREAPVELADVFPSGKKAELPALFVESRVNLKPGVVPEPLQIRAVLHVVVETQFLDAQGKPIAEQTLQGQILPTSHIEGSLNKTRWYGYFKEAPGGKLTAIVPHGLQDAALVTGAPFGGFAWRKGKDEKFHEPDEIDASQARHIPLGTLTEDVKGIEFVQRGESLKYSGKVVDRSTGKPIEGATVTVRLSVLEDPEQKVPTRVFPTKHKTDAEGNFSFYIQQGQAAQRYLYVELDVEHPDYASKKAFGDALSTIRKKEKAGDPLFFSKIELSRGKPETPAPKK